MSFAIPAAFAWAALAVPIVVFYILKIRLRRVPVSTTIFWRQIFDEKQPRTLWQQLRHWLSLLAQLLLLILLVLALTDPSFSWEILQAQRVVLVVDNSASMNATDATPTRLADAKQNAARVIAGLRMRDEMAIVAAGSQPQVVCGFTSHHRTLHDMSQAIPATDGPTHVREAVELARRLIGDHPRGRVIVFTDGCFEATESLAQAADVEWRLHGRRTGNVGITRWQVRRSLIDPIGYEILAEVANLSDEAVECRLEIDLNDRPVDVIPLQLAAGQIWSQSLEKTSTDGGKLTAKLNHADALSTDNSAWALLPKRERQKVMLVTKGNLFLQKAIEANQLVELTVKPEPPASYDRQTVYFFHRQTPDKLPDGTVFVIDPANRCDLWNLGEKLANPIVTKQDQDSPLMRHVRLDNVLLPDARQLQPTLPMQTLVQALSGDPLFAAIERPTGKTLVLTVNLDEGDLTFRTVFPILITNSLAWFAGQSAELRESLAAGTLAEIELPSGSAAEAAPELLLRSPTGEQHPLPKRLLKTTVGPLDHCGIWSVIRETPTPQAKTSAPSVPIVEVACNLANRAESDLRIPSSLLAHSTQASLAAGWFTHPIWFYLVAIAWLLTAMEWSLYQRRWLG